jgi:hypothetical protein
MMGKIDHYVQSIAEPTTGLRFIDKHVVSASGDEVRVVRVLQQQWKLTTLIEGEVVSVSLDWRDVPLEAT